MSDSTLVTQERLKVLGAVASINAHSEGRQRLPIGALRLWIEPAIDLGQCQVFYDSQERPVGYITWAFLSVPVASRVAKDTASVLHPSEWNEGRHLWIMDLVALGKAVPVQAKEMLRSRFHGFEFINYVRSERPTRIRKVRISKLRNIDGAAGGASP